MDPAGLTIYEKLRRQKGGVAVTGVVDDTCQTCGVMLVYRLIREAEDDTKLSYCESCGRIIYLL
jgi:predicted  nucleic acid-binding Zn-ribbon protein